MEKCSFRILGFLYIYILHESPRGGAIEECGTFVQAFMRKLFIPTNEPHPPPERGGVVSGASQQRALRRVRTLGSEDFELGYEMALARERVP